VIAGLLGTTVNAGFFRWTHILQVPLVLLINSFLAWHYYRRGTEKPNDPYRFGPLALQILGALLVLVQPVFDSPGGIIHDMQHGFPKGPIKPPKFTKGGFWHHGYLMAFFQVTGLLCIASASLWSAGVCSTAKSLYEDASEEKGAEKDV